MRILGIGDQHLVRSEEELRARHEIKINALRRMGARIEIHDSDEPAYAYVICGRWKIRCGCGNEPAADPEWSEALCFGCGRRHLNVVWPDEIERGVELLLMRPDIATRNWDPRPESVERLNPIPETIADLEAENLEHRIGEVA